MIEVQNLNFQSTLTAWQQLPLLNTLYRADHFTLGPINFQLNDGETLAIVGENGSGKTLLAKLLIGLEIPHSGEIIIDGQALAASYQARTCQDIRLMFRHSSSALNPAITVQDFLSEPLRFNTSMSHQDMLDKVRETLLLVGLLPEQGAFYPHMLSDGQQQRVLLARALILEPRVIIADEPFATLDPSVRSQTVNLLLDLQQQLGLSFIFISHNIGIVRHMADKTMIIDHGQQMEYGLTSQIFTQPQSKIGEKFINAHQTMVRGL